MGSFFTKEDTKSIMHSLIASTFFLLILDPIIHIGKDMTSKGFLALIDYFFYCCAKTSSSDFICYAVFYAFMLLIFHTLENSIQLWILAKNKEESNKLSVPTQTKKNPSNFKSLKKNAKLVSMMTIVFWILFLIYIAIYQYGAAITSELFNRRVIQIAPYTDNSKICMLKSKWVSMDSIDDFNEIDAEINRILAENNLQ
jgi:hypothetical protein